MTNKPVTHNLPPDNGADRKPENWENSYDKDRRKIQNDWSSQVRVDKRRVRQPAENDTAEFADVAAVADERLEARDVKAPVKGDPRNFEYYQQKEEEETDAG